MILLDICVVVIVLILGFNLKFLFKGFTKQNRKDLNYIYVYHLVIFIAFHLFISYYGGDATYYWEAPRIIPWDELIDMAVRHYATGIIYLINYIPSKILNLSFFTGNFIYATIGYLAFIYLYRIILYLIPESNNQSSIKFGRFKLIPWILYLPNLHFWSSGIGKDTLLFVAISMFFYSFFEFKRKWLLMVVSVVITFAIRPHILLFLFSATFGGLIFHKKIKSVYKILLGLGLVAFSFIMFNYVLKFVQIEISETSSLSNFVEERSRKLNRPDVESGVDLSSYSYPFKIFTFLFRPLFYDVKGILFLLSSFENVILLLFFAKICFNRPIRSFINSPLLIKSGVLFFIIGTMIFSLIMGNLGIMLRQKNMFLPWFIIFGLYALHLNKKMLLVNETSYRN